MFYPNDIIQLNNFDGQLLKINKRENRENNNIYYISYKINNLYLVVYHLHGTTEKINGSKDRYLVVNKDDLMNEKNINFFIIYGILLLIKLNIQEERILCLMIMK